MIYWIIAILLLWYFSNPLVEHGSMSPGTMVQLTAKGPQDIYLTGLPQYYPYYDYDYGLFPYYREPYPYHWYLVRRDFW